VMGQKRTCAHRRLLGRGLPRIGAALGVGLVITGGLLAAQRTGRFATGTDGWPAVGRPSDPRGPALRNMLGGATSPYLRSAASQPVAWQQWGAEAFALAKRLDRPIWLDVGAVWCHWCHVMDRESYERPEIAAVINAAFVPIKVDRDERPDIDSRYQMAFQALNGTGGGWPLTMFLTPDGNPFAGATYLPPAPRDGVKGIPEVARMIAGAYVEQHGQVVRLAFAVRQELAAVQGGAASGGSLDSQLPAQVAARIGESFDSVYGGFGREDGPKFPEPQAIRLALAEGFLTGDPTLTRAALRTLDAYARSGMRDYVSGGFFRYSVDRALAVPHFEKMDDVQAGLLRAYLAAYRLTGDSAYAGVARDILRYVDDVLSDRARGGFYAHQDADVSLDDDGSHYRWSAAQVNAAAPAPDAEATRLAFGLDQHGAAAADSAQTPHVLRLVRTPAAVARALHVPEREAAARIADGLRHLAAARAARPAPFVERTKFTDRNAAMVRAYLDAYETLGDTSAREFALRTLDLLLATALQADGTVRRTADSRNPTPGLTADYAGLADALVEGYEVTGRAQYLRAAERIMDRAVALFWDGTGAGFYDRAVDAAAVGLLADRVKRITDDPLPADNAVAAHVLNRLYLLTSQDRWRARAEQTLRAFAARAAHEGAFVATYALAAEAQLRKPPQVVVIGPRGDARTEALATAAWRAYRPGRMVTAYDPATVALDSLPEAVAGAARVFRHDPAPRAYVCVAQTCAPPTASPAEVAALVRDYGRVGAR